MFCKKQIKDAIERAMEIAILKIKNKAAIRI
jgi:hypothetical protein